jgi:hypothetical protein
MVATLEPGRGIGRNIAAGESANRELDRFVSCRHEKRVASEDERAVEVGRGDYPRWRAA